MAKRYFTLVVVVLLGLVGAAVAQEDVIGVKIVEGGITSAAPPEQVTAAGGALDALIPSGIGNTGGPGTWGEQQVGMSGNPTFVNAMGDAGPAQLTTQLPGGAGNTGGSWHPYTNLGGGMSAHGSSQFIDGWEIGVGHIGHNLTLTDNYAIQMLDKWKGIAMLAGGGGSAGEQFGPRDLVMGVHEHLADFQRGVGKGGGNTILKLINRDLYIGDTSRILDSGGNAISGFPLMKNYMNEASLTPGATIRFTLNGLEREAGGGISAFNPSAPARVWDSITSQELRYIRSQWGTRFGDWNVAFYSSGVKVPKPW